MGDADRKRAGAVVEVEPRAAEQILVAVAVGVEGGKRRVGRKTHIDRRAERQATEIAPPALARVVQQIESAIAVLRAGRVAQVDMGWVTILYSGLGADEITLPFLEICAIGLGSALFPSVDEVQRGDLTKIGDFLSTLVTSPLAEVYLKIEDQPEIKSSGHMVLIANMPFTGNNHLIGEDVSFDDGLLDVLFFADLTKLDLLTYAIKGGETGADADPRIQRFQARRVEIRTEPPMPIMVDGAVLGDGQVRIEVLRHALSVMVGTPTESKEPTSDQTTEV